MAIAPEPKDERLPLFHLTIEGETQHDRKILAPL